MRVCNGMQNREKKKYFQLNFSHTDREGERINDDHEKRKSLMEYL